VVEFVYGRDLDKPIDLERGDLVLARYNQATRRERPFFGEVVEVNVDRHPIKKGLSLDPPYRLYVDEGEPRYTIPPSTPKYYHPHHLDDIWKGTTEELAGILRTKWDNLEPWAKILERISEPRDIETLDMHRSLS